MLRFEADFSGVLTKLKAFLQVSTKAEHELAEIVKQDTEPFVPYRTGRLSENTQVKKNLIIYPGPYARYLYFGKLMVDPETGSAWARRGVKKVLTDRNLVFYQGVHPQAQSHWFEASKAQNLSKWERDFRKLVKDGLRK